MLALSVPALALLLFVLLASGTMAEDEAWATLDMADVPVGTPVKAVGDTATFRAYAHWGGFVADDPALLIIEPLPEGWTYQVEGGNPTGSGVLLYEEGLMEVTVTVSEGTEPGIYYIEPRLAHSTEARTLASLPVHIDVPKYYMVPVMRSYPQTPVVPGARVSWTMAVETGVPLDRLARLELVHAPKGWQVHTQWRSTLTSDGTSEPVRFSATVADDALPGEYFLRFRATTSDPRAVEYLGIVTIMVERTVGVTTSSSQSALYLNATVGTVVTKGVDIVNDGNVPITLIGVEPASYRDLPSGWDLVTDGLPRTLPPFSEANITVGVGLPEEPVGSPSGEHDIPLRLMTDKGPMDIDLDLKVFVAEVRGMEVQLVGAWTESGPPSSNRSIQLLLRDTGNLMLDRTVWLTFEGDPEITYIHLSEQTLVMASGDRTPIYLTVRVDPNAQPGEHWVRLRIHDGSGLLTEVVIPMELAEPNLRMVGDLDVSAVQDGSQYTSMTSRTYVVEGYVENQGDEDLSFAKVDFFYSSDADVVYLGYVPIENLSAGEGQSFSFTLDRAAPGDNIVLASATVSSQPSEGPPPDALESKFEAEARIPAPNGHFVFLVFAVALGSMAGLIAILATEAGRFALMAFILVPLYTRLKPEQVTNHFIRGQILGYVKANPGETYTHIRKALKLTNGTFVYHARILESQDLIRSVKDGANRRFYPAEMRIPTEIKDVQLNQVQRLIYTIVMEYPGINQTKISKMVKLAPSTVNYHVNIMTKVGLIERRRAGRLSLCFATDEAD